MPTQDISELRYGNISMFTWTTSRKLLGMTYGALAEFRSRPATSEPEAEKGFGLGDILITPLSLYGKSSAFDYQFQFTVWTPSGRFSPGSTANRGTGFWALVMFAGRSLVSRRRSG